MSPSAHALLSASSATRWLACPPSARLEESLPDTSSKYAEEGTLAHEIAELHLRKYITAMQTRTFTIALKQLQQNELYQPEMLNHVDTYMDYIKEAAITISKSPFITAEKTVSFDRYVPEGFGTSDCIIIGRDTLIIIDFKYGKGVPVSADDNSQMKLYAIGAYDEYSLFYPIKRIRMVIIQPRLDNISEYEMAIEDLLDWGETIKVTAQAAFNGEGEYSAGDHCKFCKVKATCRERAGIHIRMESYKQDDSFELSLLSDKALGDFLTYADQYKKWIKDVEEYVYERLRVGHAIPGWKLVLGNEGPRKFTDTDTVFKYLTDNNIIDPAMLYDTVPVSVVELEKRMGKKAFTEHIAQHNYIVRSDPKPVLTTESDKRQAYIAVTAAEVFKDINKNKGE